MNNKNFTNSNINNNIYKGNNNNNKYSKNFSKNKKDANQNQINRNSNNNPNRFQNNNHRLASNNNCKQNNDNAQYTSNGNQATTNNEQNASNSTKKTSKLVYLTNVSTSLLEDHEIEQLVATFSNAKQQVSNTSNRQAINSVRVFKDSIYIDYLHEEDAIDAVKFFNNHLFKSNRIQAILINKNFFNETIESNNENETNNAGASNSAYQIDCEIVVANRQLKKYADSINEKLIKSLIGLHTQIKYQSDEPNSTSGDPTNAAMCNLSNNNNENVFNIRQLLEDGLKKNLLYLILVSQTNEQFNSVRLFVLNKWKSRYDIEQAAKTSQINIKEYNNMPIYKVLEQIKSDYSQLITCLKTDWSKNLQKESLETIENESETKVKFLFSNPKLTDLLSTHLNETKSLNLELNDLDCLITYLNKRKTKLVATLAATQDNSANSQSQSNQIPAQSQPQVPSLLSANILPSYQLMSQPAQPTSLMSLFTQGAIPVQTLPLPLPPPPPPPLPPPPATPQQLPSLLSTISTPSLMSVQMSNFLVNSSNLNNNNNSYFSNRF